MRTFKHLTMTDRIKIEALLKAKHTVREIANILNVHRSTVYREVKRGRYTGLTSELLEEDRYSPDIAHAKYRENLKNKGSGLKIGCDIKFANYIEDKIINEGYSPAAVLGELKAQGKECSFSVSVCVTTLYSYIDKGIFLNLTNKDLPVKRNKKRTYRRVRKQQARANAGNSIEKRPKSVDEREEFGHWEMDSVIGAKKQQNTLLVMTERKTREEIIFKLPDHTSESVIKAIDELERKWGDRFSKVFKSITVDNGSEFANCEKLERSIFNGNKSRTQLYYCHPYSSWERGTNEVTNKMIRRKIAKGVNFDNKTDKEIADIEKWINNYPRGIHGYHTAEELFKEELKNIS